MIEVELRAFISKQKHDELFDFFMENANLTKNDFQETHYFNTEQDLRIQKSDSHAKIWLKKGKLHDSAREEIELKLPRGAFENLQKIFSELGFGVEIKWFRQRKQFDWSSIKVCLDYTKGYGYIIELEKKVPEEEKLETLKELEDKFSELGIEVTPKSEFNEKYAEYKNNWQNLVDQ